MTTNTISKWVYSLTGSQNSKIGWWRHLKTPCAPGAHLWRGSQVDGACRPQDCCVVLVQSWVVHIDSTSTVLVKRGGQRRFSYKPNSGPISSPTLSWDFFLTFSSFLCLPLSVCVHLCFHFYSVKGKKKRERRKKKTRSTKVVLPAVNRGRRGHR